MPVRTALRKMGNSAGIIVPKALLASVGANIGDQLELSIEDGRLVAQLAQPVRGGWAEDAEAIAAAEEPEADWLDFGNDEDTLLAW